jgi:hypothetical protein
MGSSAIEVSVSAPLARDERGAMLSDSNPGVGLGERKGGPYAASGISLVARYYDPIAFVMEYWL